MKGRKVTGRFFIFLMILVVVIFLIVYQLLPSGPKEGLVVSGSTSQAYRVQAVILRDEPLTLVDGNSTVEYVAEECGTVKKGDEIALLDGEIVSVGSDFVKTVTDTLSVIPDIDDKETCVIFRGRDVSVDFEDALYEAISSKYPLMDVEFIDGGQEIYHWIVGLA